MSTQYFDESPAVKSNPKSVAYSFADHDYVFVTDRGVFSYEKVDKATRILLDEFDENYVGNPQIIVDVGSGYGAISCIASNKFTDAKIIAVDPNERARVLTQINYVNNCEGDNLTVYSPEEIPSDLKVDLIISNPPVRVGKDALHEILKMWSERLSESGQMWLVIAKNLGSDSLAGYIEYKLGFKVKRVASKNGFRVFMCVR